MTKTEKANKIARLTLEKFKNKEWKLKGHNYDERTTAPSSFFGRIFIACDFPVVTISNGKYKTNYYPEAIVKAFLKEWKLQTED